MSLSEQQIQKLLSLVPALDHQAELHCTHLSEGITNENYRVQLDGKSYLLKIYNDDSDRLGLDRAAEINLRQKLAAENMTTATIYYCQENNFSLNHWIEGETWKKAQMQCPENLQRLVQKIKQLHTLAPAEIPILHFPHRLELYRSMIARRHSVLPPIEQAVYQYSIRLLEQLDNRLPACLCHNDLVAANILQSSQQDADEIYLLDWEYAAVNNPLFELAVICQGNDLSASQRLELLALYFGETPAPYQDDLNAWCWLYDYMSLLWQLVLIPATAPLPDQLTQGFTGLHEITSEFNLS